MLQVAEMIRHVIDRYTQTIPAILEIPSKDHPYDASKDSILRRAKVGEYSLPVSVPHFPSVLWHCRLGDRKGMRPVKKLGVGLWVVRFWLELCTLYSSPTTSITLSSNKIQSGYILVPGNPDPPGKWPLKLRENLCSTQCEQTDCSGTWRQWWSVDRAFYSLLRGRGFDVHPFNTADFQQVADILSPQDNSASYSYWDGTWLVAYPVLSTGWRPIAIIIIIIIMSR